MSVIIVVSDIRQTMDCNIEMRCNIWKHGHGKHFSITDPEGVNTVIYQINKTPKEYLKEYPKYTVDRLDYTEELRGNMKRKTFYVDFPTHEDELLIFIFCKR